MQKILILTLMIVFVSLPAKADDVYKLSMLPRFYPEVIKSMVGPLAEYFSQQDGIDVEVVPTKNFAEYQNQLKNGAIEIGYENPVVYVNVSETHEVLAMAIKGDGGDKFRGIVISRPDSDIRSIKDLRHKKIMIVGRSSAGGFLSQKLSLSENGLEEGIDYETEIASDNKQENVIIAVSIGDVDAGFIRESALSSADKYIPPRSVRSIADCAWLPNWTLSVNRSMPDKHKKAIKDSVIRLKEGAPVLKSLGLTGFRDAEDSEYDVLRKLLGKNTSSK